MKHQIQFSFMLQQKKQMKLWVIVIIKCLILISCLWDFFTVYGPWGRPDMSIFKFVKNIRKGKVIQIYNYGNHIRDFTYIDDVVNGITKILNKKIMVLKFSTLVTTKKLS